MKQYEDLVKLLKKTQATNGLDTDNASVCDYQDMIGHSSDEQLTELSNGEYKRAFYWIYGVAYGTISAIEFYCKHSEKITAILEERDNLKCDVEDLNEDLQKKQEMAEKFHVGYLKSVEETKKVQYELDKALGEIERQKQEMMELKAKLYDLMTA